MPQGPSSDVVSSDVVSTAATANKRLYLEVGIDLSAFPSKIHSSINFHIINRSHNHWHILPPVSAHITS